MSELGGREHSTDELRALAVHAGDRVALYRRKMNLGRGDPRRLAELERVAQGANDRLSRARARSTEAAHTDTTRTQEPT